MAELAVYQVGNVGLTRVPYFDVALDPAVAELTAEQIAALDWATPSWATAEGQVLVGQAVWVVESRDQTIVVDPCGAADPFLRTGPEAIEHQDKVLAALRAAGFPPEGVDAVVLSHLEGIGMAGVVDAEGGWTPAFPNARIIMTTAELEFLAAGGPAMGLDAMNELIAQGAVDGVEDGHEVTDEVSIELTGAHTPGHAILRIRSDGDAAIFVGHLAVNPLNVATAGRAARGEDETRAAEILTALFTEAEADESLLIGPLWPFPGAGYAAGDRIIPAG